MREGNERRRLRVALAVALVPVLVYPLVSLAGGLPRFPSRDECARPPRPGLPVNVVFARLDSPVAAERQLARVLGFGFPGSEVQPDDCGRWVVVLEDVPTEEVAREVAEEARSVGLEPTLELGSSG